MKDLSHPIHLLLFHMVFSTLAALALLPFFDRVSPLLAMGALTIGTVFAFKWHRILHLDGKKLSIGDLSLLEKCLGLFLIWVFFRFFLHVVYFDQDSLKTLLPNNLGDLPFHISQVTSFVEGPFPFKNPSFSGDYLRYPFGVNLYSSLWESLGVPLRTHFFLVGFICSIVMLYFLYKQGAWLSWVCLLLGGGSAGWKFFSNGRWINYQDSLAWKNIVTTLWVPQRSWLIGLPLALYIFNFVLNACRDRNQYTLRQYSFVGFMWGVLPVFHTHSFVFLSLFIAILLLRPGRIAIFRQLIKWAFVPATAWMLFATDFFTKEGQVYLQWGWQKSMEQPLEFWFVNLGGVLLIYLMVLVYLIRNKNRSELELFVSFVGLFVVFQFIIFSKWDWDNIKLLIWPVIGLSGIAWRVYVKDLKATIQTTLCLVLSVTGFVSIVASMNGQKKAVEIYNLKDTHIIKELTMGLDPQSRILAHSTYNHPLGLLGYKLIMGYEGHLMSHGIGYSKEKKVIESTYKMQENAGGLVDSLGADYIIYSPVEQRIYGVEMDKFTEFLSEHNFEEFRSVQNSRIYKRKSN